LSGGAKGQKENGGGKECCAAAAARRVSLTEVSSENIEEHFGTAEAVP
jgi:hypothetical protein